MTTNRREEETKRIQFVYQKSILITEEGRIGLNVGKVWYVLNEVSEISTQGLSHRLSLSIEGLALAVGWSARENNIYIMRKDGLLYVNNGIKSNIYYQKETEKGYPPRIANFNC